MPIFEPETLLNTPIEDFLITGEHAIPQWLHEPFEEPVIIVLPLDEGENDERYIYASTLDGDKVAV